MSRENTNRSSATSKFTHPTAIIFCIIALSSICALSVSGAFLVSARAAADDRLGQDLLESYKKQVEPLLAAYCSKCHSSDLAEADVDFSAFTSLADLRASLHTWQRASEMLESRQMPPKEAKQPTEADRITLQQWVRAFLTSEAKARDGDPGRVVLRRLNNAEYTYTIRDLTGVDTLDPTREFPIDSAAGEGFTNTGSALVMSPTLVTKYLDAAKNIAGHAVLLPDGFRFSPATTRRDWTEELLAKIRRFYDKFADSGGGTSVNLQGIQFDTNQGGRLPLAKYLSALLSAMTALRDGGTTIDKVARDHGLNRKYLGILWDALGQAKPTQRSLIMDRLRERFSRTREADIPALVAEIEQWQRTLWKFNAIGHIGRHLGRRDGPATWMEAVSPLVSRQDFRLKLTAPAGAKDFTLYLNAGDAGDGSEHDELIWENPRLVAAGRRDIPLGELRALIASLDRRRIRVVETAERCLKAAREASAVAGPVDCAALAQKYNVEPTILQAWLDYMGLGQGEARFESYMKQKMESASGHDFVKGWVDADALSVVANSSDEHVRIPGNLKPHSIAVHPAPTRSVIIGWRSPESATMRVEGSVQHAHPECGNGVTWSLELRRGFTRQRLAGGTTQGAAVVAIAPLEGMALRRGDLLCLIIGPRDGNHSCDLTAVDLSITGPTHKWTLAADLSGNLLEGNPHADSFGNADVWHLASEADRSGSLWTIPSGSLLARWQSASSDEAKDQIAQQVETLLQQGIQQSAADTPDGALYRQLTSLSGPLLLGARESIANDTEDTASHDAGVDPKLFGKRADGSAIAPNDLAVRAPSSLAVQLPTELIDGCEFVTSARIDERSASEASVQAQVGLGATQNLELTPALPVIVADGSEARKRFESAHHEMRQLFPAALCYHRIVPVDEVVTLNLYFREDDQLKRLMLDDSQAAELDRMWSELFYVSQEPLLLEAAFEQIYEFATQDRPDMVKAFEPMRKPVHERAAAFRRDTLATESKHLDALIAFAARAYRRPLTDSESHNLRQLYATLREKELPHEEAWRLVLARVLVSPPFLYHLEAPPPGKRPQLVSNYELASRLSYFLWSSAPDDELLAHAAAGDLQKPEILLSQTRRMLKDPRIRRLATEFGTQWLHIYEFNHFDEKSEQTFPTFAALRPAMYEESILFLTDLFQNNQSLLNLIDADYTFLNDALARHYEIPGVEGEHWRRVEGVRQYGRGGILSQAATLSKQAGASRTSPILRGNWLSEVVLGERLPRPPKNVPVLPETAPADLSERQLIERHSADPACAKCHVRIDPMGFALENYDAIGRFRSVDYAGHKIDANARLVDGTTFDGYTGLRQYLARDRRTAFERQFLRKLLGYALGRAVQLFDEPLLERMQHALQSDEFRSQSVIEGIVLSKQFREIRGIDQSDEE